MRGGVTKGRTMDTNKLLAVLRRILERNTYISDYRKDSSGRVVRYTDWKNMTRRSA